MGLTGTRQVSVEVGKASQPEVGDEEMDADSEHPGACHVTAGGGEHECQQFFAGHAEQEEGEGQAGPVSHETG